MRASNWFRVVGDAHFESFLLYDNVVNTVFALNIECRIYYFGLVFCQRRKERNLGIFIIQAKITHVLYREIILCLFQ